MSIERKYKYDYPENRKIGRLLTVSDRTEIANELNISKHHVYKVLVAGERTNSRVLALADAIVKDKDRRRKILCEAVNRKRKV